MKEVTYKDWIKNPTPRMMWCWNSNVEDKVPVKVISVVGEYSEYEYAMEKQCKTVDVELPITNDDARKNSNIGYWQITGYEEIKEIKE